jgi:hypothetical protein
MENSMEVMTREPSKPETDPPAPRPWRYTETSATEGLKTICEPETPDLETSPTSWHEDTPTEPGYGHGV